MNTNFVQEPGGTRVEKFNMNRTIFRWTCDPCGKIWPGSSEFIGHNSFSSGSRAKGVVVSCFISHVQTWREIYPSEIDEMSYTRLYRKFVTKGGHGTFFLGGVIFFFRKPRKKIIHSLALFFGLKNCGGGIFLTNFMYAPNWPKVVSETDPPPKKWNKWLTWEWGRRLL